jgi:hypothetical protein
MERDRRTRSALVGIVHAFVFIQNKIGVTARANPEFQIPCRSPQSNPEESGRFRGMLSGRESEEMWSPRRAQGALGACSARSNGA